MSGPLDSYLKQAEHGDLRPQLNPLSPVLARWSEDQAARAILVPVLLQRFTELARPIGDASRGARPELRLSDAGRFFYLVEALQRSGCRQVEETLLVLLDEFAQLEERSYDELYICGALCS
jgi:hypothetical protein